MGRDTRPVPVSVLVCKCGATRNDAFKLGDSWFCRSCGLASISPADYLRYARRGVIPATPPETPGDPQEKGQP